MWLKFDRFGRNFLFGRIPGSNLDKKRQQVNFVNIHNVNSSPANLRDHISTDLPILDTSEIVHDSISLNVARELINFDAVGFQVNSSQEDDKDALETFSSNTCKYIETNQYIEGFPQINYSPPVQEELDSIYGPVLARSKDNMKSLDKDQVKL